MNAAEFRELADMCRPATLHSKMIDDGGRVVVALGKGRIQCRNGTL